VSGRRWRAADIGIVAMRAHHAEQVLAIYQVGLDTDNSSFETSGPTWAQFDAAHLSAHRLVACHVAPATAVPGDALVNTYDAKAVGTVQLLLERHDEGARTRPEARVFAGEI
jgi:L-amino acid N-acyltransferase YncA